MTIIKHDDLPFQKGYRSKIFSRKLVGETLSAKECQLWEQKIPVNGYIIPHSHPTEEIITLLSGEAEVTLGEEKTIAHAPATLFIPSHVIHSLTNIGQEEISLLAFLPTNNPQVIYPSPPAPVVWD